ncbi:MAG: transcriptional regulator [Actinomycetales bacterium]|nr:transcriptional regulator [Actinomycetales bacterium]
MKLTGSGAANVGAALLQHGAMTPVALAQLLNLTSAAIRKHLDTLTEQGLVQFDERAPYGPGALDRDRGRGRPARVFSLTAKGRATFGKREESIALSAVKFLEQTGGEDAVVAFANQLADAFAQNHPEIATLSTTEDRVQALVAALNENGYASDTAQGIGDATQICQHNCPIGDVAQSYPQVCEAERAMFSNLLGVHVTRLATIAKGNPICTTLVPTTGAKVNLKTTATEISTISSTTQGETA